MKPFIGIDNKKADKTSLNDYFKKDHLGDLNINNQCVKDVLDPVNSKDVSTEGYTDKIKSELEKEISQSHITSSTNKKNVVEYLMDNFNESSSENNVIVQGITDYKDTIHQINEKSYPTVQKDKDNK